jgi:hypothetical protein
MRPPSACHAAHSMRPPSACHAAPSMPCHLTQHPIYSRHATHTACYSHRMLFTPQFKLEQDHEHSTYRYVQTDGGPHHGPPNPPILPQQGMGNATNYTGMTWVS